MSEDLKDKAEKFSKLYLTNLARKLQDGKSLTEKEFKHLQSLTAGEQKQPGNDLPKEPEKEEVGIPEHLKIKRHYTLSDKALEQRRRAARGSKVNHWKHGKTARNFLSKIKPCHKTCEHYPCEVIAQGGTKPGSVCLDKAAVISAYQSILKAVEQKDYKDFNDLAALTIAESIHTIHMLIEDIIRDGTMAKREKFDKDGKLASYEIVPHPSLLALPKLIADLGITPAEFLITPRSIKRSDSEEDGAKTIADLMSNLGRSMKKKEETDEG